MSKYRYEIWKNILTKLVIGKEYSVDNTRPDYDQFVDALKSFAANWWNFVVKDNGTSITFVMLDPIAGINEMIDYYTAIEVKEVVRQEKKVDNFYTRSYNPEEIEKQRKLHESLPKSDIPGTSVRDESTQTAFRHDQTNDHLSGGISGHSEKDNASTGLKQSQNKNNKYEKNTEW